MTLGEAARKAGFDLNQPCGGQGRCGRCAVIVDTARSAVRRRSTIRLSRRGRGRRLRAGVPDRHRGRLLGDGAPAGEPSSGASSRKRRPRGSRCPSTTTRTGSNPSAAISSASIRPTTRIRRTTGRASSANWRDRAWRTCERAWPCCGRWAPCCAAILRRRLRAPATVDAAQDAYEDTAWEPWEVTAVVALDRWDAPDGPCRGARHPAGRPGRPQFRRGHRHRHDDGQRVAGRPGERRGGGAGVRLQRPDRPRRRRHLAHHLREEAGPAGGAARAGRGHDQSPDRGHAASRSTPGPTRSSS